MENKENVVCVVCSGKGGWSKEKNNHLDSSWQDCGYCDGYGFIEQEIDNKDRSFILKYNHYKKKMTEALSENICSVESFLTEDMGKTIRLKIVPFNKTVFSKFIDYILRLGFYSSNLDIQLAQRFFFDGKKKRYLFYWELELRPDELSDLDGFIDAITIWEREVR